MIKITTPIEGLYEILPSIIKDERGYFYEAYNKYQFRNLGIDVEFVQDNHSLSTQGVLRGVHSQRIYQQAKLVRVIRGKIWDVAVDMRPESPTYGKWYGTELSSDNKKQLFIPENFAHGFLTLSEEAEVIFKVTDHYHPGDEIGFKWNDSFINIQWPIENLNKLIFAEKDKQWKDFKETFPLNRLL